MIDEPKEKKIIDEDWKSQVEAERETAKQQPKEAPTDEPSTGAGDAQSEQVAWPQPSLPLLVTTLATQAMAAMGLMAHPAGAESSVDLAQAKHFVDTIGMLAEKTRGNCTPEETGMFDNLLHELRMAYLAVQEKQGKQ